MITNSDVDSKMLMIQHFLRKMYNYAIIPLPVFTQIIKAPINEKSACLFVMSKAQAEIFIRK